MLSFLRLFVLLAVTLASVSEARTYATLELGSAWQTRNDVGIPSVGGTRFSLLDAGKGPVFAGRVYLGHEFDERHGLRLLYAPLSVSGRATYSQNLNFAGQSYAPGVPVETQYQFNSYRLTYRYAFYRSDTWLLHGGFTAKIRDAKIALRQGAIASESKNVGFVPLLHFAATYQFDESWALLFDLDGLAAPQGRAFDASLQASWMLSPWLNVFAGYRTVEGGAENDTVFTFAWVHYLTAGATFNF